MLTSRDASSAPARRRRRSAVSLIATFRTLCTAEAFIPPACGHVGSILHEEGRGWSLRHRLSRLPGRSFAIPERPGDCAGDAFYPLEKDSSSADSGKMNAVAGNMERSGTNPENRSGDTPRRKKTSNPVRRGEALGHGDREGASNGLTGKIWAKRRSVGLSAASAKDRDLVRFNIRLAGLAARETADAAEEAEGLLFRRIRERSPEMPAGRKNVNGGVYSVDIISFNTVLNAWAKCGCGERAGALLSRMEYLSEERLGGLKALLHFSPNAVSYGTVIDAWAQSGEYQAALEAEGILRRVQVLQDGSVHANVRMYSSVINAHAKSRRPGSAKKAERLLKDMELSNNVRPNAYCYTSVIDAWAKTRSKGSTSRAVSILDRLLIKYRGGDKSMRPSVVSFAAVMDAWASSGEGVFAAKQAEELLRGLEEGSVDGLGPNVYCYTNVIKAWARSGTPECGEKAEAVYRRMLVRLTEDWTKNPHDRSLCPNAVAATAVMNSWVRSRQKDAAYHAEKILDEMESMFQDGNNMMRPDFVAYSSVIRAWAQSSLDGSALMAEAVFRRMVDDYQRGNIHSVPSASVFKMVVGAYLQSGGNGEVKRAVEVTLWADGLAESLGLIDLKADSHIAREVLMAIVGKLSDLELMGEKSGWCDGLNELNQTIKPIFDICCETGALNDEVLLALQGVLSPEFFRSLLGAFNLPNTNIINYYAVSDLPPEWSRNSSGSQKHRRTKLKKQMNKRPRP